MKLIIEEYWNKVKQKPGAPFGSIVLPEYVLKERFEYDTEWTRREWRKSVRKRQEFLGFNEQGRAKFNIGTYYGINTYQLVWLEDR